MFRIWFIGENEETPSVVDYYFYPLPYIRQLLVMI